jgi:uncharacterized protein with HEPN domain
MKNDDLYVIHIRECIDRIHSYIAGIDQTQFMSSSLIQDAVLRNLQVLAESTQRLSEGYSNRKGPSIFDMEYSWTCISKPDHRI